MRDSEGRLGAPQWLILVGGVAFILVLALSAAFEADIRWLHFFQAWMYVAAIALGLRKNKWGYFIGLSAAGLWDYDGLFVTTFVENGMQQLMGLLHTGHLARPDLAIAVPAWLSNLAVVIGCVWGYARLPQRRPADILQFIVAFALTTGFFAADMALFHPSYLGIFPGMLHPHWP